MAKNSTPSPADAESATDEPGPDAVAPAADEDAPQSGADVPESATEDTASDPSPAAASDTPEEPGPTAETTAETSASVSTSAAAEEAAATESAEPPSRGHVRRDGGKEHLSLPPTASGNVVVTDMTNLEEVPASGYDVVDGRVMRRGGVWAAGDDRFLVEYDRG